MTDWASVVTGFLWQGALAATPMALLVAAICRWMPCRPHTRHTLWLFVLVWFLAAPLLSWWSPVPTIAPRLASALAPPEVVVAMPVLANKDRVETAHPMHDAGGGRRKPNRSIPASILIDNRPADGGLATSLPPTRPAAEPARHENPTPGDPPARLDASPHDWTDARTEARTAARLAPFTGSDGRRFLSRGRRDSVQPHNVSRVDRRNGVHRRRTAAAGNRRESPPTTTTVKPGDGTTLSQVTRGPTKAPPRGQRTRHPARTQPTAAEMSPTKQHSVASSAAPAAWPIAAQTKAPPPILTASRIEQRPATPIATPWREWLAGLNTLRIVILGLPPVPTGVWLAGGLVLALAGVWRVVRFRALISTARAAPASVQASVVAAAESIGLRRVPETLMISARTSPMICCGRRARLLLPVDLWSQLDQAGRQAVICHELAHLRRRDHWVRWVELTMCILYWWHPIVWWVRHRISCEAENCCDAWVTYLAPGGRRAYAEALLTTKRYLSREELAVPAVGIGVTTGRAGRFARRLTMVMTGQTTPMRSARGIALVLALGCVGWVATPAWSCPNEKKAQKTIKLSASGGVVIDLRGESGCECCKQGNKKCDSKCATACAKSACDKCVMARGVKAAPARKAKRAKKAKTAKRARRAERAPRPVERMRVARRGARGRAAIALTAPELVVIPPMATAPDMHRLHPIPTPPEPPVRADGGAGTYLAWVSGNGPHDGEYGAVARRARAGGDVEERLERLERSIDKLAQQLEKLHGLEHDAPPSADRTNLRSLLLGLPQGATGHAHPEHDAHAPEARDLFTSIAGGDDETITRSYKLPSGKLKALSDLMVRSDVPILVSPKKDRLEVHATERQHASFAAFVRLLDPEADVGADAGAFDAAMLAYTAFGTPAGQYADTAPKAYAEAAEMYEAQVRATEMAVRAEAHGTAQKAAQAEVDAMARQLEEHAAALEAQARSLEAQARALEMQAEQLEREADELEEKADRAEEVADDLDDDESENNDEQARRTALLKKAQGMGVQATYLQAQSEQFLAQSESLVSEANTLNEQAEGLLDQARQLDEEHRRQLGLQFERELDRERERDSLRTRQREFERALASSGRGR